ncbi:hypothetical protein YC2023_073668 [Brassica napus]
MQWGASVYYAVESRRTHYIMVHPVFVQPSEEQHTMNGHVSSEAEPERLVFNHSMSKCSELRGHLVVVS